MFPSAVTCNAILASSSVVTITVIAWRTSNGARICDCGGGGGTERIYIQINVKIPESNGMHARGVRIGAGVNFRADARIFKHASDEIRTHTNTQ